MLNFTRKSGGNAVFIRFFSKIYENICPQHDIKLLVLWENSPKFNTTTLGGRKNGKKSKSSCKIAT